MPRPTGYPTRRGAGVVAEHLVQGCVEGAVVGVGVEPAHHVDVVGVDPADRVSSAPSSSRQERSKVRVLVAELHDMLLRHAECGTRCHRLQTTDVAHALGDTIVESLCE